MGENTLIGAFIGMLVAGVAITLMGVFGMLATRSGKKVLFSGRKNIAMGLSTCVIAIIALVLLCLKKGIF